MVTLYMCLGDWDFCLPRGCPLIVSKRRRLDLNGGTHVRTFPGATVNDRTTPPVRKFSSERCKDCYHPCLRERHEDRRRPHHTEEPVQGVRTAAETLARVLFTGIPPRKNTPGEVRRACSGCLCGLCVHLGRRSSGVTAGTGLWSSVVKAVGPNP